MFILTLAFLKFHIYYRNNLSNKSFYNQSNMFFKLLIKYVFHSIPLTFKIIMRYGEIIHTFFLKKEWRDNQTQYYIFSENILILFHGIIFLVI